jgi:hypothetical protein
MISKPSTNHHNGSFFLTMTKESMPSAQQNQSDAFFNHKGVVHHEYAPQMFV